MMADDLGMECLGCYGGRSYQTPNLDALAAGGVRFEQCHSSPVCGPSRVQIMTGRYPFRTGWTWNVGTRPAAERYLDWTAETTFGHALGAAG
jgi:arylsulfatase A